MGDRPKATSNPNVCVLDFWNDGLQPDFIEAVFSGWGQGPDWGLNEPEVPDGLLRLPFVSCNLYQFEDSTRAVTAEFNELGVRFDYWDKVGPSVWQGEASLVDPFSVSLSWLYGNNVFTVGNTAVNCFTAGSSLPASWDAADLFGVPLQEGYFAEELPPTQYDRYVRYAAHLNNTNLHIIGDF